MKGKKLATIGLSFVLAVGCCAVVGGQKVEPQAVVAASTENTYVYSIENYTKGTLYELDFVNDYFGYSAPYSEYNTSSTGSTYALKKAQYYRWNIAYTYDACYNEETQKAEVTVSTLYFNGQDQYMAVAPDDATGAYKVESITKVEKGIASFTFEIPEDGYVVTFTNGDDGVAPVEPTGGFQAAIINVAGKVEAGYVNYQGGTAGFVGTGLEGLKIDNCNNYADITSLGHHSAGIVGNNNVDTIEITNSTNYGDIYGGEKAAGIVIKKLKEGK